MRRLVALLALVCLGAVLGGCQWNYRDPLHPQACYGPYCGCPPLGGCAYGCR